MIIWEYTDDKYMVKLEGLSVYSYTVSEQFWNHQKNSLHTHDYSMYQILGEIEIVYCFNYRLLPIQYFEKEILCHYVLHQKF